MSDPERLSTVCVRAGRGVPTDAETASSPISPPLIQSATYSFETMASLEAYLEDPGAGFLYTRYENPTVRRAEAALAELEATESSAVFSSGMAAITSTLLAHLAPGDHIVSMRSIYGGAFKFIRTALPRMGIETDLLETNELAGWEERIRPATKILYLETPTNPGLGVVDLRSLAASAKRRGILTIVDSTFGTPIATQPIALGCDLVVHSASKYLGGHSDLIGGVAAGRQALIAPIGEMRKIYGGSADPFAAWLMLRGMRTLAVRMEAHSARAMEIAKALGTMPAVRQVNYPGLASHPAHALAVKQMRLFGGMLSFDLGSYEAARAAMDRFQVIQRAASLGGVESLASIPIMTSHTGYTDEELMRAGVSRGMVRLSVGLEDARDLIEDLAQAMR